MVTQHTIQPLPTVRLASACPTKGCIGLLVFPMQPVSTLGHFAIVVYNTQRKASWYMYMKYVQ